jgi:hypothetical protein
MYHDHLRSWNLLSELCIHIYYICLCCSVYANHFHLIRHIECQTLPQFIYVKPDSFVDDVKYHCDLDDPLFTEETNLKKCKAECSYVCDVCNKVFKSQKSLQYISLSILINCFI